MNYKKVANQIVEWIRQQVKKANCNGVVFGLSGGVDSSVVAVLCKEAFPEKHLALVLPCFSSKNDLEDAKLVIEKFNLNYKVINLENVFLEFCKILEVEPHSRELSVVNIKPRLRMITLYHYANKLNYLVVGTGNKSELTMGYFTKYGDGGVDILPLGDLTKKEVYKLAKFLKIPQNIIEKPPSAGLWNGQTDEGEMGIKYKDLDRIIEAIEKKQSLKKFNKEIVNKVLTKSKLSLHKLLPPKIWKK